jgi:hypothetical protein
VKLALQVDPSSYPCWDEVRLKKGLPRHMLRYVVIKSLLAQATPEAYDALIRWFAWEELIEKGEKALVGETFIDLFWFGDQSLIDRAHRFVTSRSFSIGEEMYYLPRGIGLKVAKYPGVVKQIAELLTSDSRYFLSQGNFRSFVRGVANGNLTHQLEKVLVALACQHENHPNALLWCCQCLTRGTSEDSHQLFLKTAKRFVLGGFSVNSDEKVWRETLLGWGYWHRKSHEGTKVLLMAYAPDVRITDNEGWEITNSSKILVAWLNQETFKHIAHLLANS